MSFKLWRALSNDLVRFFCCWIFYIDYDEDYFERQQENEIFAEDNETYQEDNEIFQEDNEILQEGNNNKVYQSEEDKEKALLMKVYVEKQQQIS